MSTDAVQPSSGPSNAPPSPPPGALNIDPRLHTIQDGAERPTSSNAGASSSSATAAAVDDPDKAAAMHAAMYNGERAQDNPHFNMHHLLKSIPPNALPPVSSPNLLRLSEGLRS